MRRLWVPLAMSCPHCQRRQPRPDLKLSDAAALTPWSVKTLKRAIKAEKLAAYQVSGRWHVRHDDLDAWLEARRSNRVEARAPKEPSERAEMLNAQLHSYKAVRQLRRA